MMLFYLPARLSLLAPVAILMRKDDFRMCVKSIIKNKTEEKNEIIATITDEVSKHTFMLSGNVLIYNTH